MHTVVLYILVRYKERHKNPHLLCKIAGSPSGVVKNKTLLALTSFTLVVPCVAMLIDFKKTNYDTLIGVV
jgi:hypothetical protein